MLPLQCEGDLIISAVDELSLDLYYVEMQYVNIQAEIQLQARSSHDAIDIARIPK